MVMSQPEYFIGKLNKEAANGSKGLKTLNQMKTPRTDASTDCNAQPGHCFNDGRDQRHVDHTVPQLMAQRIYGLALGYEDLKDHVRLHITVLIGTSHMDRPHGQPVIFCQRPELRIEIPFAFTADLMRGRAAVIHLQMLGHFTQPEQRRLQTRPQRQQRLRLTTRRPLPARIRQHCLTEQMIQRVAGNADLQFCGVRPTQLHDITLTMRLGKDRFIRWIRDALREKLTKAAAGPRRGYKDNRVSGQSSLRGYNFFGSTIFPGEKQ